MPPRKLYIKTGNKGDKGGKKKPEMNVDHVDTRETLRSSEHHVEELDPRAKYNETTHMGGTDMSSNGEPHEPLDTLHSPGYKSF